jgi:predicted DNA-binding transcriptional regulator AlpA
MSVDLPPGVTIAPPPPELNLGNDDGDDGYRFRWRYGDDDEDYRRNGSTALESATEFPERSEVEGLLLRSSKLFACSGSVDSERYAEATKYRTMPTMSWLEARVALNRLVADTGSYISRYRVTAREYVALAEFALAASGFEGFEGRKGDNAVKLREELRAAIRRLHGRLDRALDGAEREAGIIAKPIAARLRGEMWHGNRVLWAMVPTAADAWVRIIEATAEQATAALDYLRATLATWQARRPVATDIAERLDITDRLPTALDYAEALHVAEMLAFLGEKLTTFYAAIMHSMPVYQLYPATSDHEAISLWWPWGRPAPLIDGKPPQPSAPGRLVLDPASITATRPQDVVKEVIAKTGMSRTTAQRLTAAMRSDMRLKREQKARTLLYQGVTKAEVAKQVGLSPARISALFKGQKFPTKRRTGER